MTPRMFHLLWDRYREHLLHRELIGAYTSAAIYNLLGSPKEPILESAFMPNYAEPKRKTAEQERVIPVAEVDDFMSKRAHIAALLEKYKNTGKADNELIRMGLVQE